MKYLRITGFITAAIFLMLFIACGGDNGRQSPPDKPPSNKTPLPDPKVPDDKDTLDTEPPTIPLNLMATAISSNKIELSWDESTDNVGVAGYNIYRDDQIPSFTSLDPFYLDEDLSHSTEYCYRVSAFDAAENESDKSEQVCVTTPGQSSYPENPDPDPDPDPDPHVPPAAKDIQPDELQALIESGDVKVNLKPYGDDIAFIGGDDLSGIFPYKVDSVEKAIDALNNVKTLLGINDPSSEFKEGKVLSNPFGVTYKLQQINNGVPVYAREIIINTDIEGKVLSLANDYYRDIDIDTTPAIEAEDAEAIALDTANESGGASAAIMAQSELVIYTLNGHPPVLAWLVTAGTPGASNDYFIDQSGTILNVISNNRMAAVGAAGFDLSGENRNFTVNQTGGKYELLDPARNVAIYSPDFDVNNGDFKGELLVTSDNNVWSDSAAVSAMANISATYDYYKDKLFRDSIDGDGSRNGAVIHFKNNETNEAYKGSFWNGSRMVFGDGEPYIGALDVVAHEFTHGVVDYTAGFIYQGQSGALHEAYADIFGELVEMDSKYKSDTDVGAWSHQWIHGQDLENPRSLENPNATGQPKEVGGLYFENDYLNVHVNSSVISHAAYLMWTSREFTKTELAQLWYLSLFRLTPYSEFSNVRYALTDSARVLQMSAGQIEAINSDLDEVKVDAREWGDPPLPDPPTVPLNLTAIAISTTEIELSWEESTDNVGVAGYRIFRDNFYLTSTSFASYMDHDLLPSTEYCYRVSAYDAAGNESGKSEQACATTDDEGHLSGTSAAPQNLTATAVSSTEIELSWDPPTDYTDVVSYYIYRDDSLIFNASSLGHNDSDGLTPSTLYCYQVSAVYPLIESDKSEQACTETLSDDNPFNVDGINMTYVPAGTFTMGCTAEQLSEGCDNREKPAHTVTLSDFYIGKYEVTQKLWKDVMGQGNNPSIFTGDNLPVENVTFDEVQEFIRKLNVKTGRMGTGKEYRLPTEAEWEYAARGGGNNGYRYSGSNDIGEAAWYLYNSATETYPLGTTHHVGTKKANGLGLYDMSGNVSEWVSDIYGEYGATPQTNPKGPAEGLYLLSRGGSFTNSEWRVRLSFRNNVQNDSRTPAYKSKDLGFRLAADR